MARSGAVSLSSQARSGPSRSAANRHKLSLLAAGGGALRMLLAGRDTELKAKLYVVKIWTEGTHAPGISAADKDLQKSCM